MSSPVVTDSDSGSQDIPSLLVPMAKGEKLLLPTVTVAEMINYQPPKPSRSVAQVEVPKWYLGDLAWRSVFVPMLSYEAISGEAVAEITTDSQIIIINSTGISPKLPFICIPTQGIPRLSRVTSNDISENTQPLLLNPFDAMHVLVGGEKSVIPDVSELERAFADLFGYPNNNT